MYEIPMMREYKRELGHEKEFKYFDKIRNLYWFFTF